MQIPVSYTHLALAAVMAFSFAACGGSADSKGDDKAADDKAEDSNSITVAAVETAYGKAMWESVAKAFTEETGIEVNLIVDKKLEDIITPDMKAGNYPDVIMRAVGSEQALTETFVKDNNVLEMTDVLEMTVPGEDKKVGDKILPGFTENSITNPYGDGKTYLMPMFYGPCGLFYNAALFKCSQKCCAYRRNTLLNDRRYSFLNEG